MPDALPTVQLSQDASQGSSQPPVPEPALTLWLLQQAREHGAVLAILRSAPRMDRVAAIAAIAAMDVELCILPPWDTLPYDRSPPTAAAIGRRAAALIALHRKSSAPRLLLTCAAAMLTRIRPADAAQDAALTLAEGDTIDLDHLRSDLATRGYHWDERVDEPGEVALRGRTIDIFPAASLTPVRIELDPDHGTIATIHSFDPLTQLRAAPVPSVTIHPAADHRLDETEIEEAAAQMAHPEHSLEDPSPDAEPTHPAPAQSEADPERLLSPFTLLPGAPTYSDDETHDRWSQAQDLIADAYETASAARRGNPDAPWAPKPARLFLTASQAQTALAARPALIPTHATGTVAPPPTRLQDLATAIKSAPPGTAIVIATPTDPAPVASSLQRRNIPARAADTWADAIQPGAVSALQMPLRERFEQPGLLLLPIGPLLKHKATTESLTIDEDDLGITDIVVHLDHGVSRLSGLRDVDGEERIALECADGAELLVPTRTLDRLWRYGGDGAPVPLDRISGDAWREKRTKLDAEIAQTAKALAKAATARSIATAPRFAPDPARMTALDRRFPYPLSAGQRTAIEATLHDLASGRPMDRLVCGDVGFGKTEVALRAAAAVALCGAQTLIAAPTTVLARQHLETFRRRFEGSGIRVEGLIRNANSPDGRRIAKAAAAGEIDILVGTQGLAGVTLKTPGLAIIDEEQRFGEDDKRRITAPHMLVMTATPIPRTMQTALVGLRDVSIINTPPARRLPTRSFVLQWEAALVRDALLRERRRGGQSFIVCPRIADVTAMQAQLHEIVPELDIITAHGRMKPETLDDAVTRFSQGKGDVLLATNIIEAGLDIPRANLMLVTNADRFGLAQLHQLRGRVGRGARQGTAYLLTEPGRRLAPATLRRLRLMETLSGLGAGVQVAAADLDLRGAGDLFGDKQTGHVRAVGTALYQHLLAEAVAAERDGSHPPPAPTLHTGLIGRIPADYVPEPTLRLTLYRRLACLRDPADLDDFTAELADRFGPIPDPLQALLLEARLRIAACALGLTLIEAGPNAVAISPPTKTLPGTVKNDRQILPLAIPDPVARATELLAMLS